MFVNLCHSSANQLTTSRLTCVRSSLCTNARKVCEVFELLARKLTDREMISRDDCQSTVMTGQRVLKQVAIGSAFRPDVHIANSSDDIRKYFEV